MKKKMIRSDLPALPRERRLTAAQFQALADVPPEAEWFAKGASSTTIRERNIP